MTARPGYSALLALAAAACTAGPPEPAVLDTLNEACASCRMSVSDPRFASQLVASGETPLFFDDLGCLAAFVKAGRAKKGTVVFVADHRTRVFVRADRAVYTRVAGVETPMGSHVLAHADAASRDQDAEARGGAPVPAAEMFGPASSPAESGR
jgi:copper chaperone NosL